MSKAVEGAALLGGAAVIGALTLGVGGVAAAALMNSSMAFFDTMVALGAGGVAMEAGAIADALTSNRGMNITTRQTAANRQIIYGQQRVGGVFIYKSTTGSHHDQFNYVIVLAGHTCDSIVNLYLDGRQVHWTGSGPGNVTRNGVNFGGNANSSTYTGPSGLQYNFGGKVYCEARHGDQSIGDVISGLTANDPIWAAQVVGGVTNYPSAMGCTYVYLKIEYDPVTFPGEPEIRFTINGKNNIYDPRTSSSGFTTNWALIAADVITDPVFGLGDNTVNQAQLIAAANVCGDQVPLAWVPSGTEDRYTTNYHYDTSVSPGDVLAAMMQGAAGRLSRIGGEWFLWPAYWQGPSFAFDENSLTADIQWTNYRSVRDLVNRVNGTYIAPTFPYNIAGNLYDHNGFYNGTLQNNFPFAFQTTNFPQYAVDTLHGYSADEYLIADNNKQFPMELSLSTVLSVSQAQRVAKINLLRNRQQGSGTFEMSLAAFAMQPTDVMQFTFAENGWTNKNLEIVGMNLRVDVSNGVPSLRCSVNVIETDPTIYAWSTAEELNVYDQPNIPLQMTPTPAPPTSMALNSGTAINVVGADGSLIPRLEVTWNTPADVLTTQIAVQYQLFGSSNWETSASVSVTQNLTYISPVIVGASYNVRIASVRPNGVMSTWVEIDNYTITTVSSYLGTIGGQITAIVPIAYAGLSANLIPNGNFIFGNIDDWAACVSNGAPSYGSGGLQLTAVNASAQSPTFNVTPGQKYRFSFTGQAGSGSQSVYLRVFYDSVYHPNTQTVITTPYTEFMNSGSISTSLATYTYDWICPANTFYASLAMYRTTGTALLTFTNVSAQDYVASSQWGADVTTLNIPTELLTNGSFEQGLVGWSGGSAVIDTAVSKYGTQSLKSLGATTSQTISLLAGHTYIAQVWVKTDGAVVGTGSYGAGLWMIDSSGYITVQKINGVAAPIGVAPGVLLAATSAADWTLLQITFHVSTSFYTGLNLQDDYGTSTPYAHAWFDGVSLQDITGGADVTGSNTAYNTLNVGSTTASTIAGVIPNSTKIFLNSGSRTYSITAV